MRIRHLNSIRRVVFVPFIICILAITTGSEAAEKADHGKKLEAHYRLDKPPGNGPFPAVILVPGCSGFEVEHAKAAFDKAQQRLVALGFATVRVNYLAARNVPDCRFVPTENVAGDIALTVEYLLKQTYVRKDAVNLLGWAWGGASVLRALSPGLERKPVSVDAVVAYYPHCPMVDLWDSAVPVLVLHGRLDEISPIQNCEVRYSQLASSTHLTQRSYKDTRHGFDFFSIPAVFSFRWGTMGYNEQAAKAAWKELTAFLRK